MSDVKYFICPMSKNILDSILEIGSDKIGILPTRRQIDYNGGYVNNWTTKEFFNYAYSNHELKNVIFERDHGGVNQGVINDGGYESFKNDSAYFNLFHLDPWKVYPDIIDGVLETINYIKFILKYNPLAHFEVGTEEDIRKFPVSYINLMLELLNKHLDEESFVRIQYVVIQSGESLDLVNKKNKGTFDVNKFNEMIAMCNTWGKKSKEHNGDFLSDDEYKFRFDNGLSSINIGPEFAMLETSIYLDHMTEREIDDFYTICLRSKKWKRWIPDFGMPINKRQLIEICGHYNYSSMELPKVDDIVKDKIKNKITNLLSI